MLDAASKNQYLANEYMNLTTRRQVPFRLLTRSALSTAVMVKFRAIVAIELDPPSASERKLLQDFADNGGLVVVGPSWGNAPTAEPYAELPVGKGRVAFTKIPILKQWRAILRNCSRTRTWGWLRSMCRR